MHTNMIIETLLVNTILMLLEMNASVINGRPPSLFIDVFYV